jgi:hypothetical protein
MPDSKDYVHITTVEPTENGKFVVICYCKWQSIPLDTRVQALAVGYIHRMANK